MRWFREPLFHFLVIGLALLGLYRLAGPAGKGRIVVSQGLADRLGREFHQRTGKAPTRRERADLIRRWVEDEALLREARSLGLDRTDAIVRRRLIQKMELLAEALEPTQAPTDATLRAYLRGNEKRYRLPPRLSFTHVFVGRDRHGARATEVAARILARLGAGAAPGTLGDPFLHGRTFRRKSRGEIESRFGSAFAAGLGSLSLGVWSGPVRSSYGLHLVRLDASANAEPPRLEKVRARVHRDWEEDQRARRRLEARERLRRRYDVRLPPLSFGKPR